ncbi:hypothetical protein DPMN_124951 [Dreissena polymorpha]|uniref:Uncharacterized protein n=1 Tax=Dreissena polymorpha TaxID=45954 RepID=A0A9D4GUH3_DREPO|nr:hypothetical protein DPMN_124951 [Dreissena polymorpha]
MMVAVISDPAKSNSASYQNNQKDYRRFATTTTYTMQLAFGKDHSLDFQLVWDIDPRTETICPPDKNKPRLQSQIVALYRYSKDIKEGSLSKFIGKLLIKLLLWSPFLEPRTSMWCLWGRSKDCFHSGHGTHDLPVTRRTPYPLHHGNHLHLSTKFG